MNIKQRFFTFRDGLTADVLRKGGVPHKIIFGLQIPQLSAIAKELRDGTPAEELPALADSLWEDRDVRESRLLACYLWNPESVSEEKALALALDVRSREEADILVFRILRHLPYTSAILGRLPENAIATNALRRIQE